MEIKKELLEEQKIELLKTLKSRFEKNMKRHQGVDWTKAQE